MTEKDLLQHIRAKAAAMSNHEREEFAAAVAGEIVGERLAILRAPAGFRMLRLTEKGRIDCAWPAKSQVNSGNYPAKWSSASPAKPREEVGGGKPFPMGKSVTLDGKPAPQLAQ